MQQNMNIKWEKLWPIFQRVTDHTADIKEEISIQEALYSNGLSLDKTLEFLFKNPSQTDFENWVKQHSQQVLLPKSNVDILTAYDLAFFEEHGYIILKNAVSKTDCTNAVDAICSYAGIDINDSTTWYQNGDAVQGMMLSFFEDETLHHNRCNEKIYQAYRQLYQTNEIFASIDKVSFNPPETANYKFRGTQLHWDVSLAMPIPFSLQGLIYLNDTPAENGAFACIPGFHHDIETWLNSLSHAIHPRDAIMHQKHKLKMIEGNAGDCIIWMHALPHCATPNMGKTPRFVQYLTYTPYGLVSAEKWI
jgi:ectoine hydroxylase-related dioxygenase (phytanoyl-CoA dioxygenase family)